MKKICISILFFVLSSTSRALTVPQEQAKSVFLNYQKLEKINDVSEFGKWFRVTSSLTALDCFSKGFGLDNNSLEKSLVDLGLPATDVKKFVGARFETTGNYFDYSESELSKMCPSIAINGFKPYCSATNSFTSETELKQYPYPNQYIALKSGKETELSLRLKCSVTYKETMTSSGVAIDMWPVQSYSVQASDIETLESSGIKKWEAGANKVLVTAITLPSEFKSSSPLNLPKGLVADDVLSTNIVLKIKSLPTPFPWTLIVEPFIEKSTSSCTPGITSVCGLFMGAAYMVGGTVVLVDVIKNIILPGTSVQVRLDSGEIRKGTLTHIAVGSRKVHSGDLVLLDCSKATESVQKKGSKVCSLDFTGFDPDSMCPKGSACYGIIPSWTIEVDATGTPDSTLLKLE